MNAQAVALKKSNFEIELENYEPQLAAALPAHISVDKFKRVVMTAVARDPALYTEADRRTLFNACIQCANDGLLPDGREAALIIFNTKDRKTNQWVKAVQYLPMIHGIRKKMRNTGEVTSAEAHCVYQNDDFDYALGDQSYITHKPKLGERGAMIGAYAIIKLANGEVLREVMSRPEIEKVRAVSRSKDSGPWVTWFDEMARKSVLRRCAKAAPVSSELERLLNRDDAPEPPTSLPPPRPTRQAIAALVEPERESEVDPAAAGHANLDEQYRGAMAEDAQPAEAEKVDAETGEVTTEAETPATDWPALAQQLKEGADDQKTVPELDEYYGAQRSAIAALEKGDAKLGGDVMAHLNARRKKLLAEKNGGGK